MYTVELNVIDKVSLAGATAIARVYVMVSRINAIIAGSAVRYRHDFLGLSSSLSSSLLLSKGNQTR